MGPHKTPPKAAKAKKPLVQVRIYKNDHGVLRRLAFRKGMTIAAVISQMIK